MDKHHGSYVGSFAFYTRSSSLCLCVSVVFLLTVVSAFRAHAQIEFTLPSNTDPVSEKEHTITRPSVSGRVVRVFDFEGLQLGSIVVPPEWYRAQSYEGVRDRPGFPPYNEGSLDYSTANDGTGSIVLLSKGGSASMRLFEGEIPVFPRTAYAVEAFVRTQGASYARASTVIRFLDENMDPIAGAERRTREVWSEGTWTKIIVQLDGSFANARYLQIDLELLQESQRATSVPEGIAAREDIDARAWFDSIRVLQLPQVQLLTSRASNLYIGDERPSLRVLVRDLTGEEMRARVDIVDDSGMIIEQRVFLPFGGQLDETWTLSVPRFGWYEAVLHVENGSGVDAIDRATLLWVSELDGQAQLRTANDRARSNTSLRAGSQFGIWFDTLPLKCVNTLPDVATRLAINRVKLPMITETILDRPVVEQLDIMEQSVLKLQAKGHEVVLGIDALPESWARAWGIMPTQTALAALLDDGTQSEQAELLDSVLMPVLDRFGDVVERWQFGRVIGGRAVPVGRRVAALETMAHRVAAIAPADRIMIASGPHDNASSLAQVAQSGLLREGVVPMRAGLNDAAMDMFVRSFVDASRAGTLPNQLSFAFHTLDNDLFGNHAVAADLARRTIRLFHGLVRDTTETKRASTDAWRFTLIDPVGWRIGDDSGAMPNIEAAVWRTLAHQLTGRTGRTEIHLADNVRCMLFNPRAGESFDSGIACVWSEDGTSKWVQVPVGPGDVHAIDMFGNEQALERTELGTVRIKVNHDPIIVQGIDTDLAAFRSTFTVHPSVFDARIAEHEVKIELTNTWDRPTSGRVRIVSPGGFRSDGSRDRAWEIEPRVHMFSAQPHETLSITMLVRRRVGVETGPHALELAIEVQTDAGQQTLRHFIPFAVGLESIDLIADAITTPRGPAVRALTTNTTARPMSVVLTAAVPGRAKHREHISNLMPGHVAVRVIPMPATHSGSVSVSATVVGESGMLTRVVEIENHAPAPERAEPTSVASQPDDAR